MLLSRADYEPWGFATNPLQRGRHGRIRSPSGWSEPSVASASTTSWCWARRIYVGSCESTLAITILRERTGHRTRMLRSLARFSRPDGSCRNALVGGRHHQSGSRFSAGTGGDASWWRRRRTLRRTRARRHRAGRDLPKPTPAGARPRRLSRPEPAPPTAPAPATPPAEAAPLPAAPRAAVIFKFVRILHPQLSFADSVRLYPNSRQATRGF